MVESAQAWPGTNSRAFGSNCGRRASLSFFAQSQMHQECSKAGCKKSVIGRIP